MSSAWKYNHLAVFVDDDLFIGGKLNWKNIQIKFRLTWKMLNFSDHNTMAGSSGKDLYGGKRLISISWGCFSPLNPIFFSQWKDMNFVKQKTNIEIVNKYLDMYEDIDTLILSTAALAGFFGISQSGLQAGKVSKTKEGLTLVPLNTLDAMMAIAGHCTRLDSAKTYLDRNKDTKDIHLSCRKK